MARLAQSFGPAFALGSILVATGCGSSGRDDQDGVEARGSIEGQTAADAPAMDPGTAQFVLNELTTSTDIALNEFTGTDAAAANGGDGIPANGGEGATPTIPPDGQSTTNPGAADDTPHVTATSRTGVTVPCVAAGTANVGGHVNVGPQPLALDVRAMVLYDRCVTYAGTTLNGNVEISQSLAQNPENPLQVETIYAGDVELHGPVNAKCPVDVNVVTDVKGQSLNVGGTFCGQDASTLKLEVAPRWAAAAE